MKTRRKRDGKSKRQVSKTPRKKRPKQFSFLPKALDFLVGPRRGTNAKSHRPLDSRKPLHVCFRSRFAAGKRTMLGVNKVKVHRIVAQVSQKFGITIVKFANVGNHLHLVVRLPGSVVTSRRCYSKWIRLLTSRLAFEIGGSRKGRPLVDEQGRRVKFWDAIPFSRVIHGRRGWNVISRYILKNLLQAEGLTESAAIKVAAELFDSNRALDLPNWNQSAIESG